MSARGPERLVIGCVAIAFVGLAGCPRFDDGNYLFRDELEGPLCDGTPCGWTQVAGPAGAARWEESLPGEHGLHLDGNSVAVRIEPAVMTRTTLSDLAIALDLIARCDLGSTLTVEVGVSEAFTGRPLALEPTSLNILGEWTEPRPNAVILGTEGNQIRSIDSITIVKSGDGTCEIDAIGIFEVGFGF